MLKHIFATIAVSVVFSCQPMLQADEWNKKTVVTVDQEIQLPNVVLQPGTYVLRLLDSQSDRHIVKSLALPKFRSNTTLSTSSLHRR